MGDIKELAEEIKRLRLAKGWIQEELAEASGLGRSYISQLETAVVARPPAEVFFALARALKVPVGRLFRAAGYEGYEESGDITSDELLQHLESIHPMSLPVYRKYPAGKGELVEPIDHVYLARPRTVGRNITAHIAQSAYLEPTILEGDIIIVDSEEAPKLGDIVACVKGGELHIGRLKMMELNGRDSRLIENNHQIWSIDDCEHVAVIIQIERRLR